MSTKSLTRIAVIYDGNYFRIVSNYYNYNHPRRSYLSIGGLHEFIRQKASRLEETPLPLCQIVDAHYFRGRMWAQEASQLGNRLYRERVMDDILMAEGVTQHNLPLRNIGGRKGEKGIDVWLALETYELAVLKKFDVIALFAADGDYVPLVRKLNTLGVRVMLLGWDFETMTEGGFSYITRYSRDLAWECSYPIEMHPEIEMGLMNRSPLVQNLFPREGSLGDEPTAEQLALRKSKRAPMPFRPPILREKTVENGENEPISTPIEGQAVESVFEKMDVEKENALPFEENLETANVENGHESQLENPALPLEPTAPLEAKTPQPEVEKPVEKTPERTYAAIPESVRTAPKPTYDDLDLDLTEDDDDDATDENYQTGFILKLLNGFGFIERPPHNVFFHYTHLHNTDFNSLRVGDMVEYLIDEKVSTPERLVAEYVGLLD